MLEHAIINFAKTQGDYLAFVALALLAIIGITLVVRRFRPTMQFLWQLWLVALVALAIGWGAVNRAGENARVENMALVSAMAPTYAVELERMGHDRITEATPPDDPLYLELIQAQIRWEKLNPFAHDIYTFRKRADGTNILVVDSETDYDKNGDFLGHNEARTPIGQIYPEPVSGLEQAFLGVTNFDSEVLDDEWGSWVSAFVPMRDATGKVEAVLGVDFDAHNWLAAIAKARREAMLVVAFLLVGILGGGTGILLLRADIGRRTLAEQRLRESEQRLLLTIQQVPLGFIEWDVAANVRMSNPAAGRILGYAADEMNDQNFFSSIVAPSAVSQVGELWSNLLHNTGGRHSINENITKDGRVILCEWFNTPLIGPDNRVVAVFSLFQDITERVNLEKQLQRSERLSAIGQLSAGVAHDFNNILTIITGHAGILLAQENVPADFKTGLLRIEAAALRAAGLTRQLLAFSRRQTMFPRMLALGKVVQDISSMLSRLISAAVNFKIIVAEAVPPIEGDPAMIEQVVTNLVLNARDALENGGDITVSVDVVTIVRETSPLAPDASPEPVVRLIVRDTGSGISPANISRIFEPFFTTKSTGKGSGLGLSVVHGIIQQHGGWITVESAPGEGSAFFVHFLPSDKPVSDEALAEMPEPSSLPDVSKGTRTILVVEDEIHVRELACTTLEQAGYRVLSAADGPQALETWAKQRDQIDLLLTDMVMPNGMTGRELSELMLADRPELAVICASGYGPGMIAPGFCDSQRRRFLSKPYQTQQLIAAVRSCLEPAKTA